MHHDRQLLRLGVEPGVFDGDGCRRGQRFDQDVRKLLFDRLGDLIRTGPTNTNVNDLVFIVAP